MRFPRFAFRLVTASAAAALLAACGGDDERSTDPIKAVVACESLAGQTIGNVQVTSSAPVTATGTLPAFCRVRGTEAGTMHDIEVRMPETWTQRFVQQGGGGFDGSVPGVGTTNVALEQGAVLAANNGGHRDPSGNVMLNNEEVVKRYAHTAIPVVTDFGKALAVKYYGKEPSFSYYQGCSNGGRGAFNAAAKYSSEFDAVIAGAPTMNLTGQIEQWTRATKLTMPSNTKLAAVSAAAVQKCDALDGATDGMVLNWAACQFDATVDVPASVGLTAAEAAAVKSMMTDLKLANGTTIYSAYGTGQISNGAGLGVGHMRNIVLNNATWDSATFDVDSYYPIISAAIDGKYGFSASSTALANFLKSGKKIVVWHGSDDGLLSHKDTLRTWQTVTTEAGGAAANSKVYIAGGVNHCGGGRGADRFDLLKPMMDWVEKGIEPGTITASKVTGGVTTFTRPLCVHPAFPKYNGTGDVNSASSFTCSTS
jgi:Tannase and feruloyl esterase